jgi:peptide/nickel transport system substrate-binding protein
MSNRVMKKLAAAMALTVPLALGACTDTLRIASHAPLTSVDPVWTTAYATRSHGYLVYDTLFAMDANFEPKPQMVDSWTVSDDQKTWTFKLRDGLKWQDATNVTAEDCVASLARWGKRDGMGQQLFKDVESLTATDDKTFVMTLKEPNGSVLESLAKLSANVPFIMPKRVAETDAWQQITDTTGSGPFIYDKEDSKPNEAVYVRNPNYVPRPEEQSLAAGGKVAKVDRIEWIYFPKQIDAVNALIKGKVDYVESPSTRLVPLMEGKKNITVASTDPLGNVAMVRFNALIPPFDKPEIRRAVLMAINQNDYMTAALGDQRYWRNCYSVYPCGTPLATEAGSEIMKMGDIEAAKKALKAAGYNGTPVVILNPTNLPVITDLTRVTANLLQQIGMKVEVQDMDWAALVQRRVNRGPVSEGGWNMFHTWWIAADLMDPTSIAFSGDPEAGWIGWPKDEQLETLRADYVKAGTQEEKQAIATNVQERLWAIGAFGVLGQFFEPVAFRSDLKGITSPIQFYWGVEK